MIEWICFTVKVKSCLKNSMKFDTYVLLLAAIK